MATIDLVKSVAIKKEDGTPEADRYFGVSFENVIDERASKGNYSLAQFFDSYDAFMKENFFVYRGTDKPANTKVALWIQTGVTNQDDLDLS